MDIVNILKPVILFSVLFSILFLLIRALKKSKTKLSQIETAPPLPKKYFYRVIMIHLIFYVSFVVLIMTGPKEFALFAPFYLLPFAAGLFIVSPLVSLFAPDGHRSQAFTLCFKFYVIALSLSFAIVYFILI